MRRRLIQRNFYGGDATAAGFRFAGETSTREIYLQDTHVTSGADLEQSLRKLEEAGLVPLSEKQMKNLPASARRQLAGQSFWGMAKVTSMKFWTSSEYIMAVVGTHNTIVSAAKDTDLTASHIVGVRKPEIKINFTGLFRKEDTAKGGIAHRKA